MSKTTNRRIAFLLVCLQILLLLTAAVPQARAEGETGSQSTAPKLNQVYTGTVQFGTFNYTAAEGNMDGADYRMPFIYTDDYFAAPSYSEAFEAKLRQLKEEGKDTKTLNWTDLEDKSLATASMDFTMACFGSNEEATDEQDYTDGYDKNGRKFLEACGFEEIESNNYSYNEGDDLLKKENHFNKFPSKDSIGVIIGSKDITVWEGAEKGNQTYKLVAIGVRGAGYGAEWASNLTLGPSGEHQGFREAANKVEYKLDEYLSQHDISTSSNVKFWVCGYSRSGAVANLVAGDLTSKYGVDNHQVYGYTFESAAGADASVDADGNTYPNIHNIINKMDAVPRVSMAAFGNHRYGVDYLVPYYRNTENENKPTLNSDYYNLMYRILQTIAKGYPNGETDPVITKADPSTYPLDGKIQVFKFEAAQANNGSFGAVPYEGKWKNETEFIGEKEGSYYFARIDTFLDDFVTKLFSSSAWDYDASKPSGTTNSYGTKIPNTSPLQHRTNYVTKQSRLPLSYQEAIRTLVSIALGTPGAKLTDALSSFSIWDNLINAGTLLLRIQLYDSKPNEPRANDVNSSLSSLLYDVLTKDGPFASHKQEARDAVNTISPVLTRLVLYDRNWYGSQYLGTLLKHATSTILVTHTPELDVSWQMAMDDNYISDFREITLPKNTVVKMLEFRGANTFGTLDFDGAAPVVAEFKDGAAVDGTVLDSRIKVTEETETTFTIRYPGNIDVRFDVKASDAPLGDTDVTLADLAPRDVNNNLTTNVTANYTRGDRGNIVVPETGELLFDSLKAENVDSANEINTNWNNAIVPLEPGDTLQILAEAGSNRLDPGMEKDAQYTIRKTAFKIADFGKLIPVASSVADKGEKTGNGGTFDVTSDNKLTFTPAQTETTDGYDLSAFSTVTSQEYSFVGSPDYKAYGNVDVIPATNIYYNDSCGENADLSDHTLTTTLFSDQEDAQSIRIQFYGTAIDAYCTCDSEAGWVRAEVLDDQGQLVGKQKIVGNNYNDGNEGKLYNVPTVHFDLPEAGTYTLVLTANLSRDYKLDGVRVYNTKPDEAVAAKLAQVDEASAAYINVRDLLLGKADADNLTDGTDKSESAVFFTGDGEQKSFSDYTDIGPKREVYLTEADQGIAFNVEDHENVKVEIGLRAADTDTGFIRVTGEDDPLEVTGIDSYYTVTPDDEGNVRVEYGEGCTGKIAITYIKLTAFTDVTPAEESTEIHAIGPQNIRTNARLLAFVNTPDPEPTENPISELISQLLSMFVQRLWESVTRIFGHTANGVG